jgi:hypothetical protein
LAYRAAPAKGFVAGATAATVYVVNPFVYGRLHYGQLFLLAGYAALPWVAARLRWLLFEPRPSNGILLGVSLALIGVLSIHILLECSVVLVALVTASVAFAKNGPTYVRRMGPALMLASAVPLLAGIYWIVPLLNGRGFEGTRLAGIGSGDLYAFAAVPDSRFGLVPNLLGLYGFWAEDSGRFTSMKAFVPLWPAVLLVLLMVAVIGVVAAFRQRSANLSSWVAGLVVAGVIALLLEMGESHPITAGAVGWIDAHIALYRGMRDAGKWASVLALVYSQLAALGAVAILGWIARHPHERVQLEWVPSLAVAVLLALPLYYGNGLLYGAHGEIKPSRYPSGWYAVDRVLALDKHPGRTLFLPWHEYMSFTFIRNQNNVVAPPGPSFFSVPMVVSADPEVPGISPPNDRDQVAITSLVRAGDLGDWAQTLAERHIKYVIVARELDWAYFKFLDDQPGLTRVRDFGSIILYRNELVS